MNLQNFFLPLFIQAPGAGATYEEGGDCLVPGTPTISLPPRNDGFAEVSSSERLQAQGFPYSSEDGPQH